MINIDNLAYSSKIKNISPEVKLFFTITNLIICLWSGLISISVIVLVIMSFAIVKKVGIASRYYLRLMLIPMAFLLIGLISILFTISQSNENMIYYFYIFDMYVGLTKAGGLLAIMLFFKALACVSCMYFLSLSTPMVDLMSTLKRLKCPNMLLELMSLIYRFIFALMETAHSIHISQTSRLGHSTLPLSFKSSGVLISRLFILSMKKSEDIYVALESRGYDGEINVLDEKIQGKYSQYLKIIALNIFLVFITVLIKQGSWKI